MKCPICKKDATKEYFPFCSEKCQLIDLYNWFAEDYCISEPAPQEIEDEDFSK